MIGLSFFQISAPSLASSKPGGFRNPLALEPAFSSRQRPLLETQGLFQIRLLLHDRRQCPQRRDLPQPLGLVPRDLQPPHRVEGLTRLRRQARGLDIAEDEGPLQVLRRGCGVFLEDQSVMLALRIVALPPGFRIRQSPATDA